MDQGAITISDPLATIGLREVVRRTGIGRTTILRWLAADTLDKRPGRNFPRPLGDGKMRWNEAAMAEWFVRHHAGEKVTA